MTHESKQSNMRGHMSKYTEIKYEDILVVRTPVPELLATKVCIIFPCGETFTNTYDSGYVESNMRDIVNYARHYYEKRRATE